MMSDAHLDTAQFLRRFGETGTRVVLIGGMAAITLGVAYVTQDIDFCYDISPANRVRLLEALAPLQPRLRVGGLSDADARALPWRWDERAVRDGPNLTLQTDAGPIDLLSRVSGVGGYAEVLGEAVIVREAGLEIAVLDLPGLVKAKRAAGRTKDMAILPMLESMLLLRAQAQKDEPASEGTPS